jgi:AICAR transformylase/IMP cyclohydrolase PurH
MKDNNWIKDMDANTIKYIVGLQEINKSLIKTLKIYGGLLRKTKFENENHEEMQKAIGSIDKVIASVEKLNLLQEFTLH